MEGKQLESEVTKARRKWLLTYIFKKKHCSQVQWLMLVIRAAEGTEIRRTKV
jgi:hypothetical protein